MLAVAADNLRAGRAVIADSVNPLSITRDAWRAVAEKSRVGVLQVEITCSDLTEHRRRVENRVDDEAPGSRLTWPEVLAREYEFWPDRDLVIDTYELDAQASVDMIIGRLRQGVR